MKKLTLAFLASVFCLGIPMSLMAEDAVQERFPKPPVAPSVSELQVPEEGTPADYLAFITKAQRARPDMSSPEALQKDMETLSGLLITTADKVMGNGDATDQQYLQAAQAKINALGMQMRLTGDAELLKKQLAIPEEAKKAGRSAEVAAELEFGLLQAELQLAIGKGKDELAKVLEKVEKALEAKGTNLQQKDFYLADQAIRISEHFLSKDQAKASAEKYLELFRKAENERLAAMAETFKKTLRRLNLVGSVIPITGKLLDGTELDMDAKKGKVVLIDFWATWCGPCVAEVPNVKKLYEAYHPKGFDVISISLDRDVEALEKFIAEKEIPWDNLLNAETQAGEMSMADYCGVMGIPCMILCDKDGKVISINARGATLENLLKEMLGDAE